jgi:DNA polymerase-3 subunit delta'
VPEWNLTGNEQAAVRLREAAARGTLAHALLFSGSGDRMAAAQFTAAALQCTGDGVRPCGVCPACRKVREGIHPDVITVQDAEHKNLAVDVIRSVRSDAYVRPNEGVRKVYIFPDCDLLTEQDQNVLLKIVEEGPPYAAFLFCAENPAAVLPTLRSRCVELKLRPAGEQETAFPESAAALCRAMGQKKRGGVTEVLIGLERGKLTREDLQTLLDGARSALAAALLMPYGQKPEPALAESAAYLAKSLTKSQIMGKIELLQKYRQECQYNVSAGQVLGALATELEGTP